jgi:cyanate permease
VLTHVQKLLETSETERTDTRKVAKMEKAQQKELFFGFSFFFVCCSLFFFLPGVLKTDNMNKEDLKQQVTAHTFSESTGVFR